MASTFRVEREQCIDAPPAAVRKRVVDLRRWVSYGEVARPGLREGTREPEGRGRKPVRDRPTAVGHRVPHPRERTPSPTALTVTV
jgi:hypothetical protein